MTITELPKPKHAPELAKLNRRFDGDHGQTVEKLLIIIERKYAKRGKQVPDGYSITRGDVVEIYLPEVING